MEHLVTSILAAKTFKDKMHFGMAEYVDDPTEFWHDRAWGIFDPGSFRPCCKRST